MLLNTSFILLRHAGNMSRRHTSPNVLQADCETASGERHFLWWVTMILIKLMRSFSSCGNCKENI